MVPALYRLARFLMRVWFQLYFRLETFGVEHVPAEGGCILAGNHVSFLDPPLLGVKVKRLLRYMARASLFRFKWFGWALLHIGCVPLDRAKGDVHALKLALRTAKEGGALVLFPEGTRSPDGALHAPKPGVGFLVAKAGVPVVPVYIDGSYKAYPKGAKWMRPAKIRVFYGPPVLPAEYAEYGASKEAYGRIADLIMSRIAALAPRRRGDAEAGALARD